MKRLFPTLAAAALACAATLAVAQGGPGYGPGAGPRDGYGPGYGMGPGGGFGPGAGAERQARGVHREQMRAAFEACKDKPDRRACVTEQVCAKSADPAQCQARAKQRAQFAQKRLEQQQKMHEACTGKRGDELSTCMRAQHQALRAQYMDERQKAHEACNGKRGEELGKCLREHRGTVGPRGPWSRG